MRFESSVPSGRAGTTAPSGGDANTAQALPSPQAAVALKLPPRTITFTDTAVRAVLSAMNADPSWLRPNETRRVAGYLTEPVHGFGKEVLSESDLRFHFGTKLDGASRELIANYIRRTQGVQLAIGECDDILPFVTKARATPGSDVRCAFYAGGNKGHACLVIYLKEADREAVIFVDSTGPGSSDVLETAKTRLAASGLTVLEQSGEIQRDCNSCCAFVWEAMATLCGRARTANGFGGYRIPDLLRALEARCVSTGDPHTNIRQFRALPEIARMAQKASWIYEHAGAELDAPLRDSERGKTLRESIEKHSFRVAGSRHPMLNYLQEKGLRLQTIAEIEAISRSLRREVGEQVWNDERHLEFFTRMQALAKDARRPILFPEDGFWRGLDDVRAIIDRPMEVGQVLLTAIEQLRWRITSPPPESLSQMSAEEFGATWTRHFGTSKMHFELRELVELFQSEADASEDFQIELVTILAEALSSVEAGLAPGSAALRAELTRRASRMPAAINSAAQRLA